MDDYFNLDSLKKEQQTFSNSNQDWKEKYAYFPEGEGSWSLRILPPKAGSQWCVAVKIVKLNGKKLHSHMVYSDGKWVGDCPMHKKYRETWDRINYLTKQGKLEEVESLKKIASSLKGYDRFYFNVIIRDEMVDNKPVVNQKPKVWSCGKDLYAKMVDEIVGNAALKIKKLGNVLHLENGRDFHYIKRMKKGSTYPDDSSSRFSSDISPAGTPEQIKLWMENLHDLSAERKLRPVDELEQEIRKHLEGEVAEDVFDTAIASQPQRVQTVTNIPVESDEVDADWLNSLRNA